MTTCTFYARICLVFVFCFTQHSLGKVLQKKVKPQVGVTIFIHGTVGSSFNIFNPFACLKDSATEQTFSVRIVRSYRNHPLMEYDQIFGAQGLFLFDDDCKKMSGEEQQHSASCYLIPAYQTVAKLTGNCCKREFFARYGWSGLLSQRARYEAAESLYWELIKLRKKLKKRFGVVPVFRIIAHSHGGNVMLLLAEMEERFKEGLRIEVGFMLGTPMHFDISHSEPVLTDLEKKKEPELKHHPVLHETGFCIASPVFSQLYLASSRGDSIQCRDFFSTTKRKSYGHMHDIVDLDRLAKEHPKLVRCDVQICVADDEKRIDHTNMWLAGRSEPVCNFMEPFPFVVLVPYCIKALEKCPDCTNAILRLYADEKRCWLTVAPIQPELPTVYECHVNEEKIFCKLREQGERMHKEWQLSWDHSRHPLFNKKNGSIVKSLLFG